MRLTLAIGRSDERIVEGVTHDAVALHRAMAATLSMATDAFLDLRQQNLRRLGG